jgi:ferritin-like metal-binding protein YciE
MQSLKDLFEKELKNLYAFEKQIQDTMMSLEPSQSKKLMKRVDKFTKYNTSDYSTIQEMALNLAINPGNTTDSVAQEMLKNISEIANMDLDINVKNAGLITSLNRLAAYKTIIYFNVRRMAKVLKMKKESKALKKIKRKNQAIARKFKSLARNNIFKKALI